MKKRPKDYLPLEDLLDQLAEECSELAWAALKLRRVIVGRNPTPMHCEDVFAILWEEAADVRNCMHEIFDIYDWDVIRNIEAEKFERWLARLEEKCREQGTKTREEKECWRSRPTP